MIGPGDWRWLNRTVDMSGAAMVEPEPERVEAFFAYRKKHRNTQDQYPLPAVRDWAKIVRRHRRSQVAGNFMISDLGIIPTE